MIATTACRGHFGRIPTMLSSHTQRIFGYLAIFTYQHTVWVLAFRRIRIRARVCRASSSSAYGQCFTAHYMTNNAIRYFLRLSNFYGRAKPCHAHTHFPFNRFHQWNSLQLKVGECDTERVNGLKIHTCEKRARPKRALLPRHVMYLYTMFMLYGMF